VRRAENLRATSSSGFSLVAVMATMTVMLVLMGAAMPSWKYVMQNMREEELLFRGIQIAEAIERYQRLHGGAPPGSLEDLVKARCLRKAYTDPMARDGKWRMVSPGEAGGMGRRGGRLRRRGLAGEGMNVADRLGGLQGFVGVASTSDAKSFRIFNGQTRYDEWQFIAGQPRVIGKQRTIGAVPGAGAIPGLPGAPGAPGVPGPAQPAPSGAPSPRPSAGTPPEPDR
jgi:type II secretory pathway pseudopilin PulG